MITVIAGANGAGKSSIGGVKIRQAGGEYFNPDEIARQLRNEDPTLSQQKSNARAWKMGYDHLVNAITQDMDYTFETTLGGNAITQLLRDAMENGRYGFFIAGCHQSNCISNELGTGYPGEGIIFLKRRFGRDILAQFTT